FAAEVGRWMQAGVAALWSPRISVFGDADAHHAEAGLLRYVGCPGMTAPARFLAENLSVQTRATVSALKPVERGAGWQAMTLEQGLLETVFDNVLLAVPAPQAVPLLSAHHPLLADIAAHTTMRGSWAMMLQFNEPLAVSFDAGFVNTDPLRWVCRNSSKPGRTGTDTWLLHAAALWSEAHIEDDANDVAEQLLKAFVDIGGAVPASWTIHRWRYADMLAPLATGSLWDPSTRIGLCGDWLYGGKVEGAWLSGKDLAARVSNEQHECAL
ncbi:MAG: FAD-dependent oxidoreductase, partial [Rhodocyclaceae bacterium]|nr:FAD-dependent oxidoreductase [Rhodocyclaceae bacterium]